MENKFWTFKKVKIPDSDNPIGFIQRGRIFIV